MYNELSVVITKVGNLHSSLPLIITDDISSESELWKVKNPVTQFGYKIKNKAT